MTPDASFYNLFTMFVKTSHWILTYGFLSMDTILFPAKQDAKIYHFSVSIFKKKERKKGMKKEKCANHVETLFSTSGI